MELIHSLIAVVILIVVTVVPVMIAAKWARARRSGFLHSLLAVVVATVVAQLALHLIGDPLLAFVVAFVGFVAAYALILGSTFVAAVGIAVIAVVLQVLILAALLWLGLQIPFEVTLPVTV
ncbi:MAG: hypothetical protein R3225_04020 [Halofilum sp. (in: g-proteobacteria)]|nr:hypothetical protein [Halofilum sp. (in: g-proteobacteria)]